MDCIFCKIADHQYPDHIIWEDDKFVAFLSKECLAIVTIKERKAKLKGEELDKLFKTSKTVADFLLERLGEEGRTMLFYDGDGDHDIARLYKIHDSIQAINGRMIDLFGSSGN